MKQRVTHRLVGYDRKTGFVGVEFDIPPKHLDFAKRVARVGPDDPQAVLCYPLDGSAVGDIAVVIGASVDADQYNFYMEGFGEPLRSAS